MISIFLDALSGDATARQHVAWLLGKPYFWLAVIKWSLILLGIGILAKRLLQKRRFIWLAVCALGCAAALWGIMELSGQAAQSFRDGQPGTAITGLRIVGLVTDVLAVFVVVHFVRAALKKRA